MTDPSNSFISSFEEFINCADYSLVNNLNADPQATMDGNDHELREVFSGHYVPVTPTPLAEYEYITHSKTFFEELGINDSLTRNEGFCRMFSGDLSAARYPMSQVGWATGYALSIYGTEYTQQCPFRTGNGYGDGRAISVFEGEFQGKRWEMQLKGGGPTPYCRGADGRAVLRSSVREFLAQEYMHAVGVPTSRSLTLYVSKSETVVRPWYSENSYSSEPDIYMHNPAAISTRVASSFLRVGQIELFARRARNNAYENALQELRMIVEHLIEREYKGEIDKQLSFAHQVIELAKLFRTRLTSLVANWLRVGYCQGNFNSDNCAAGGYTLDYGPFGFCEMFDAKFQPWTGGGEHFSFFNQPRAAEANYHMFWTALQPLFKDDEETLECLSEVRQGFAEEMHKTCQDMWAEKLGLVEFDVELFSDLLQLMINTDVDFTILFRELSEIPEDIEPLKKSFYKGSSDDLDEHWDVWLQKWLCSINDDRDLEVLSNKMKRVNPKYTWREWLVVPAYQKAMEGDYSLIKELQEVLNSPYEEQSQELEYKYYRLKPEGFFNAGGVSHYSCSS